MQSFATRHIGGLIAAAAVLGIVGALIAASSPGGTPLAPVSFSTPTPRITPPTPAPSTVPTPAASTDPRPTLSRVVTASYAPGGAAYGNLAAGTPYTALARYDGTAWTLIQTDQAEVWVPLHLAPGAPLPDLLPTPTTRPAPPPPAARQPFTCVLQGAGGSYQGVSYESVDAACAAAQAQLPGTAAQPLVKDIAGTPLPGQGGQP